MSPSIRVRLATTCRDRLTASGLGDVRLRVRRVADDPRRGFALRIDRDDGTRPDPDAIARCLAHDESLASVRVVSPAELRVAPASAFIAAALCEAFRAGQRFGRSTVALPPRRRLTVMQPEHASPLRAVRLRVVAEALGRLFAHAGVEPSVGEATAPHGTSPHLLVDGDGEGATHIQIGAVRVSGDPAALGAVPPEDVGFACLSVSPTAVLELNVDRLGAGAESPLGRVQAFHARLSSQVRYAAYGRGDPAGWAIHVASETFASGPARDLALVALDLPDLLADAAHRGDPAALVRYLGVLQAGHHRYYASGRIISDDPVRTETSLVLASVVRCAASRSLAVLGVRAPERF